MKAFRWIFSPGMIRFPGGALPLRSPPRALREDLKNHSRAITGLMRIRIAIAVQSAQGSIGEMTGQFAPVPLF